MVKLSEETPAGDPVKADIEEVSVNDQEKMENGNQNGTSNTDVEIPTENGTKSDHSQSDQENQRPPQKAGNKKRRKKGVPILLDYPTYERSYMQEPNGQPRKPRRRIDAENAEPTEKLFVGGLPLTLTDDDLKKYFSQYGEVIDALVKAERGFGFVTFSSIDEADKALEIKNHQIEEKEIEVKRAIANKYSTTPPSGTTTTGPTGTSRPPINGNRAPTEYWTSTGGQNGTQPPSTIPPYYQTPIIYPQPLVYQPVDAPQAATTVIPTPLIPTPPSESMSPTPPTPGQYDHTTGVVYIDDHDRQNHQQQKKLFIGGLHWKTHDDDLREYFSTYGVVTDAMVIIEPNSNRSRGFGFVVFANPEDAERVVSLPNHKINDKVVDVKRAISKDLMKLRTSDIIHSENNSNNMTKCKKDEADELGKNIPVDKIFVGGLSQETTRESLISFFNQTFGGKVTRVDMKMDDQTGQNRGYAFLTFDNTDVVDVICQNKFHRIGPHLCEVKKAHAKDANFSEAKSDNNNRSGYHSRAQHYYPPYSYPGPVDCYYPPSVSYIPYPFAVSTVPVSTPQTQPNQNQPQNNNSTGSNEVQGEYHYGTWYPTNGKDNENGENDDHSEEVPAYTIPYYQPYHPTAYNCGPYYASTYPTHSAYAQQVKDH